MESPIINPANIDDGRIIPNMRNTVDEGTFQNLIRHRLEVGDIIFGRRGEMGRCALITEREEGWLCGTGSLIVRFDTRVFFPAYACLQLALEGLKKWLVLQSVGSTMDNLNTGILSDIPICMPPTLQEQRKIAEHLDRETTRIDGIIQTVQSQIERLREYRQAVISAAVTGKIAPKSAG